MKRKRLNKEEIARRQVREAREWEEVRTLAKRLGWRLPKPVLDKFPEANAITTAAHAGMPVWLKERLRTRAARDQVSMAEWQRQVVWEALKRPERPGT